MTGNRQGASLIDGTPQQVTNPTGVARDAVIEARLAAIEATYPERFDDEQRARVRTNLAHALDLATRLRRVPLANSDEPDPTFVPYRATHDREAEVPRP